MLIDSNKLVPSHYPHSAESLLGFCHELQHQRPGALPPPLLCPRADRPPQQWVCRTIHAALHQPEERWATETGVGGWESDKGLNYIRWHCVTIIVFPLTHRQHSWRSVGFKWKRFCVYVSCWCIQVLYIRLFSRQPFLLHLQATDGCLCGPETDAAWIQLPSSSLFGIPKRSSPYQTHTPSNS